MRALIMQMPGGSENSQVREIDVPSPAAGEITIDVAYAGLNFMDVMARRGDPGYVADWPYRPGLEVSGTVREASPDVTRLRTGQRVAASLPAGGGLAEVAVARAELAVPVPDAVPLQVAAATPAGLVSALLVLSDAGRFAGGESVLVHSASGGIGSAVAQLVPLLGGGLLVGTVGRPEKADAARQAGYDAAVVRDGQAADAIRAATNGRGVDLILDPLGTAALDLDLDVVRPGGRIVLFGNAGGGQPGDLPAAGRLIGGNLTITGFSHRGTTASAPEKIAAAIVRTLDFLAAGTLRSPVTELDSLEDVPGTHDLLAAGRGAGKYVAQVS